MRDLPFDKGHRTQSLSQSPEDGGPCSKDHGPQDKIVPPVAVARQIESVGQETNDDQNQAVPHPEEAPVLEHIRVMCFTEHAAHDLRNLGGVRREGFILQERI